MKRRLLSYGVTLFIACAAIMMVYPVWQRTVYNYVAPDYHCSTNLKQIALATFMYSGDYDGKLPPAIFPGETVGWANGLQPYIQSFPIFHCPRIMYNEQHSSPLAEMRTLLGFAPDHTQENPHKAGFTDYWINSNLAGVQEEVLGEQWTVVFTHNNKNVNYPEQIIMLGDGDGTSPQSTASYSLNQLPADWLNAPDSPATRHLGGANYAFLDGHVKWLKPEQVSQSPTSKKNPIYTFSMQ